MAPAPDGPWREAPPENLNPPWEEAPWTECKGKGWGKERCRHILFRGFEFLHCSYAHTYASLSLARFGHSIHLPLFTRALTIEWLSLMFSLLWRRPKCALNVLNGMTSWRWRNPVYGPISPEYIRRFRSHACAVCLIHRWFTIAFLFGEQDRCFLQYSIMEQVSVNLYEVSSTQASKSTTTFRPPHKVDGDSYSVFDFGAL